MKKIISGVKRILSGERFPNLAKNVIELNNTNELKKAFKWTCDPVLNDPVIYEFSYLEDVNERRVRDAESIGTVMCNTNPQVALEIGTADGRSTALMAENSAGSQIFTVNIPPEEIVSGKGGVLTTFALEKEKIGSYYRSKDIRNISQIYANTATWEPDIGVINVAFIDGCHDSDFVYNDTRKIIKNMELGSFILWHDFNLNLIKRHDWIDSVCQGVEWLYMDKVLNGPILHVRDSWVGIYRVQ